MIKKNNKREYKRKKRNSNKIEKIKKNLLKVGGAVLVLFTIIINLVGYAELSKLNYEIYYLEKELNEKEISLEQLKSETNTKQSVEEIEKIAKEELNMDYPKEEQIEYIQVD